MSEEDLIREAMRAIGKKKSELKAKTARENGKKGGRPKTDKPTTQRKNKD